MKSLFWGIAFFLTIFLFSAQSFANRALNVIADLDHKNGKIGTYRALIIAIQNYKDPKIPNLKTPLNDAKSIADVLENKYGFVVEFLLDESATRKAMYDSLRNLSSKTKDEDSVLIYYAGHGDFDRQYDDGWWIPVDAKGGDPVTYLDNVQIQKAMRSMKAKHVLLISDSCYSGTLFGQARAMPSVINDKYYLNLYNEKSRWGMTSGNKTPVSDSGTAGNSVFAYQLIKKLKNNDKPYISTQEIYTDIAPVIANNSEQQPLCRPIKGTGDQGGEFIFVSMVKTNQYPSDIISAPEVAAPEHKKVSFDDIIKVEQDQIAVKQQWEGWQKDREDEYSQVQRLDKSTSLNAVHKKKVWLRFSSGVSQDNPFSTQDDEMRKHALQRISYWGNESSNKKKLASIIPTDKESKIVARDGQYVKYENGIVYDKNTGLEWYTEPHRKTDWYKAYSWVKNLDIDGEGWRMPSKSELKTLYKKKSGPKNLTSLLLVNGRYAFSNNQYYHGAPTMTGVIDFRNWRFTGEYISSSKTAMVFAVRTRSKHQ